MAVCMNVTSRQPSVVNKRFLRVQTKKPQPVRDIPVLNDLLQRFALRI